MSLRSDDNTSVEASLADSKISVSLFVFSKNSVVFGKVVLKIYYLFNSLVVSKVWTMNPLGSLRPFLCVYKVKVIFIVILRHYLPFSLSFAYSCTLEFSRGYKVCDIAIDWMQKMGKCKYFFWYRRLKNWQKRETFKWVNKYI